MRGGVGGNHIFKMRVPITAHNSAAGIYLTHFSSVDYAEIERAGIGFAMRVPEDYFYARHNMVCS